MKRCAVFSRWPEPGRVKSRLSPALPPALACDLHRAMLADALEAGRQSGAGERMLYWSDAPASAALDRGADPGLELSGFEIRAQTGSDLGERLARAFEDLARASGDRALILGADCPELDGGALASAFEELARHDVVLGPARDGGYTLIGLSRPAPALFQGIPWGTNRVFEATRERARAAGLLVLELETRDDLDTPADLARWIGARAAGEPTPARHTLAALAAMKLVPAGA